MEMLGGSWRGLSGKELNETYIVQKTKLTNETIIKLCSQPYIIFETLNKIVTQLNLIHNSLCKHLLKINISWLHNKKELYITISRCLQSLCGL